jgi:plastocyanin
MAKRLLLLSLTVALLSLSAVFLVRVVHSTKLPLATALVTVSEFEFTPEVVTIDVGDTVQWDNAGGFHNVVADDSSFTSGDPDGSAWTFSAPFDTPGTYRYYCVVHGLPGGEGMAGVIFVGEFLFLPTVLKN